MTKVNLKTDLENFYCPKTGGRVLDPEQLHSSPAMVFLFLNSYRYFEHVQ